MTPGSRAISGLNTRGGRPSGLPAGIAGIVEHMRGHALFYLVEQGPRCRIGHWLWEWADKFERRDVELPGLLGLDWAREDPPAAEPSGDWSGVVDLADDEYDPEQEDWAS